MREYWPVILALVVAAAVVSLALVVALEPKPRPKGPASTAQQPAGPTQQVDERTGFYNALDQMQPRTVTIEYSCPVDGTKFKVLSLTMDNRFGGVATDFMAIMLAPPEGPHERPSLEQQAWEMLPATCPTCGATFMDVDFLNMRKLVAGGDQALKGFDLTALAPALAAIPQEQWTADQRLFARYLTLKVAGFPNYELAFYALAAAYGSNFSYWSGDPRRVAAPSAAYYALAVAHFQLELSDPASKMQAAERAPVRMTLGELERLLGRGPEAAAAFKQTRQEYDELRQQYSEALKAAQSAKDEGKVRNCTQLVEAVDQQLKMLDFLEGQLKQDNYALLRVPDIGLPKPPVGWYLDEMLPQINGYIAQHRAAWSAEIDPAVIAQRIDTFYASQTDTAPPAAAPAPAATAPPVGADD